MSAPILDELKHYIAFGPADEAALRLLHPVAAAHFVRIADVFYQRINEHEGARQGMLQKGENEARSIQLVPQEEFEAEAISLPIMGLVAAGQPIETLSHHSETLEVPPFMVGRRNSYVLQVKGESMIDEGITDGDYVVVTEKEVPSNGDMVIAMVNNGGATLKRYFKEKGHIRLQPSNATMEPIIVEAGTPIEIQGIVIGLIRKY